MLREIAFVINKSITTFEKSTLLKAARCAAFNVTIHCNNMIENLPKQITLTNLQNMNFGDIEANDDALLFDSICHTSAITQFLKGSKNIVTGEKGTGKTALFRVNKRR